MVHDGIFKQRIIWFFITIGGSILSFGPFTGELDGPPSLARGGPSYHVGPSPEIWIDPPAIGGGLSCHQDPQQGGNGPPTGGCILSRTFQDKKPYHQVHSILWCIIEMSSLPFKAYESSHENRPSKIWKFCNKRMSKMVALSLLLAALSFTPFWHNIKWVKFIELSNPTPDCLIFIYHNIDNQSSLHFKCLKLLYCTIDLYPYLETNILEFLFQEDWLDRRS